MLFDPMILVNDFGPVLATFLIIVVGKSLAAFAIVRLFRHPNSTALTIAASLAQIGEFSFILAGLGVELQAPAGEGARPDPGRRDPVDHGQSVPVHPAGPVVREGESARATAKAEAVAAEKEAAAAEKRPLPPHGSPSPSRL